MSAAVGRFAPSPSGDVHIGNLRTALLAWLFARSGGGPFLLRIEDLDRQRCRAEYVNTQIRDLRAIGLDWDGDPIYQSDRDAAYRDVLDALTAAGSTFECFCTRREIASAQSAPHGAGEGRYPGTCRRLSRDERARRRAEREPSIRLAADHASESWDDLVLGTQYGIADDVVLRRGDGAVAYNLAVVVDDVAQGVTQIVRGDDLASTTPTQLLLTELIGGPRATYGHVPLVLNSSGRRLAKRDGAVTLSDLAGVGINATRVRRMIIDSLGPAGAAVSVEDPLAGFRPELLPRTPWIFPAPPTR